MKYDISIRKLREAMLVSQNELAKILGVSSVTVSRWENAKFEPRIKIKRKIVDLCMKYGINKSE